MPNNLYIRRTIMKKNLLKISMRLVLTVTFALLFSTNATAEIISTEIPFSITYYDDGSYDIETCYFETTEHNLLLDTTSAAETKSYSKRIKHYDDSNNVCWTYTLTAYFTVNKGVSVKYKSCNTSLQIFNNKYFPYSEHHSGSNNTATGTVQIKYAGSISSHTTTITCTKYGNFK